MTTHRVILVSATVALAWLVWSLVAGLETRADLLAGAVAAAVRGAASTAELHTLNRQWWQWIELSNSAAALLLTVFAFGSLPASLCAVLIDRLSTASVARRPSKSWLLVCLWFQVATTLITVLELVLVVVGREWLVGAVLTATTVAGALAVRIWRRLVVAAALPSRVLGQPTAA